MTSTILVADDSQNIRDMLQLNLETLGYKVIMAENGEQALDHIVADRPDLLIMDVMMPKINGFQVCRRVKSNPQTKDMPVILLTARVQEEDVFWGRDCGADEYITKPFKTRDLDETVDRLLSRRSNGGAGSQTNVRDEHRRRRDRGTESQMVMLSWDPRAMDVFRKKYGEIKFSEALRSLQQETERFLEDRDMPGPVGLHPPVGLSVLIDGAAPVAMRVANDLVARLNEHSGGFYDSDDRVQGHIRLPDRRSGRVEQLPLLSFSARIDPDSQN